MLTEKWCKFVLNEGIMPASLARLLKQSSENQNNPKLLAQILKERDNFNNPNYQEISALAKKAFSVDHELNSWLNSVDGILNCIINFAKEESHTKEILNVAFGVFIKSCSLVSEQQKNLYLDTPKPDGFAVFSTKAYHRHSNPKNPKKKDFMDYLQNQHYCLSTRYCYGSAIDTCSTIILENLWLIDTPAKMKQIFDQISQKEVFLNLNTARHNALSSALLRYIEFLDSRQA